jgi:ribose/xylose/arabinose/galactoside ABC-type transport system permease subunit
MAYDYPGDGDLADAPARHGVSAARLDNVFDDPRDGEPGRDRLGVHLAWEAVLLVAAAAVGYLLYRDHRATVTGDGLDQLLLSATVLGMTVLGTGLSLRAATPNLAVGPIAFAAALYFADHADRGLLTTAVQTGVVALAIGGVLAVFIVGLHVPAWPASLAAALGIMVWSQSQHRTVSLPEGVYQPADHALYWFGGFAVVAFLGGLFGAGRSIRRSVGRFRPVADPADRRGGGAGVMGVLALLVSSALGAVAGVLMALQQGKVVPADRSLVWLGLALGGALLAGTSAFGRRGGLLGTVLATALLTVVLTYVDAADLNVNLLAVGAGAICLGLVATRLVETFGRPSETIEDEIGQWRTVPGTNGSTVPDAMTDGGGWGGPRTGGWTSPLPASSADDRWGADDGWGGR